jgi:hypothetical protein
MAIRIGNIVPGNATAYLGGHAMTRELAIIHYKAALSIFIKWHSQGIINEDELMRIDTIVAQKYAISSCSIYRSIT